MRKINYLWGVFLPILIMILTGCSVKETETSGYQIYYTNSSKNMLLSANYNLKAVDPLELCKEMWERMRDPGNSSEQQSLVPEKLDAVKWDLTDCQLTVTFNSEYLNFDHIREVLFRSGFVETVTQIPEVKKVVFHIGGDVLKNSKGEPIGAMTRSSFINNPVGINSYQYVSLALYFSNAEGNSIVKEMRNLHYSTNTTLPKVVMEQLITGPMNKNLKKVFHEDSKVLEIRVDGNTCYVNLNQAFLDAGEKLTISPYVVIYSMVNSLCDALEVDKVQFQIEGAADVLYAGELSFQGPFHRNSELIEKQDFSKTDTEVSQDAEEDLEEAKVGL